MLVSHFGKVPTRRIQLKNRSFISWVALAFLCVAPVAKAQTGAPQGAANANKIATVRVLEAISLTAEGKQASAEIQSQFAPRSAEIDGIRKQIDDLDKKLQAGQNTLSDEEKGRMTRQGEMLQHKLQRAQEEVQEEVNAARADVLDRLGKKMVDVVNRFAAENGYGVVIDASNQQAMTVLYASKQVDITDQVVKLYDQQFPIRASTAPAPKQPGPPPAQNPPAKRPGGQQ
jgi:outer membrane protein